MLNPVKPQNCREHSKASWDWYLGLCWLIGRLGIWNGNLIDTLTSLNSHDYGGYGAMSTGNKKAP